MYKSIRILRQEIASLKVLLVYMSTPQFAKKKKNFIFIAYHTILIIHMHKYIYTHNQTLYTITVKYKINAQNIG